MRSTFYAAILLTLLLGCAITGFAASSVREEFKVTEVFLKADDGRPTGPCPLRVTFRGYITANGAGAIKYTFTRSDGATGPVYIMEFKQAGTQAVMTDWTLGDARVLARYAGWQAVKVLSPVEIESNHDTGSFEINCGGTSSAQRNPNQRGESAQPPSEARLQSEHPPLKSAASLPDNSTVGYVIDNMLSTDLVGIRQGQIARLQVANTGDQSLVVWLFFRDSAGKVLIQKEVKIEAGATEALTSPIPGLSASVTGDGPNHVELRAQFTTTEAKLIGSLKPTLRIMENGQTVRLIGPEGFNKVVDGGIDRSRPNSAVNPKGAEGDRDQSFPVSPGTTIPGPAEWLVGTDVVYLKSGEVARLELKNNGGEPAEVRLQFVDEQGKVLAQKSATIRPGGNELLEFPFEVALRPNKEEQSLKYPADWSGRFRAQFVSGRTPGGPTGLLQPQLRIVEIYDGDTLRIIEPNGFKGQPGGVVDSTSLIFPNNPVDAADFKKVPDGPPLSRPNSAVNPKGLADRGFPIDFTSAAFSSNPGDAMRLTLRSEVREPISVRLQFVDKDGNVVAFKDAIVHAGQDATMEFRGDVFGNIGLKAQFGINDKRSLLLVRPTLEIVDSQTKSVKIIGPEGFNTIPWDAPTLERGATPENSSYKPSDSLRAFPVSPGNSRDFRVTEVFLKADDGRPSGPCPVKVVFNGYITTDGPGTVKYAFTRSDGATGPVYTMYFKDAGTQSVSTDWTLGDPTVLPRYEGWQAVKVLSPYQVESSHETGSFRINCGSSSGEQPNPNQQRPGSRWSSERQPSRPGDSGTVSFAVSPGLQNDATEVREGPWRSTLPIKLKPNQTARLELTNTGNESFVVRLQFVDKNDQVLTGRDERIAAGGTLELSFTGPNNPLNVAAIRAQFGAASLLFIRPTLRIIEQKTGDTIRSIGPEDFAELRPGDDPRPRKQSGGTLGGPTGQLTSKTQGSVSYPADWRGTYPIPFGPHQTALLELKNTGKESVPVRLQFVDKDGKVLTYQDATVSNEHGATLVLPNSSVDAAGIKAQFGSNDKRSLLLLRPTLEIVDSQTKSVKKIGPEGFTQIWGDPPAGREAKP